jgi:uncharacterized protein YjbI with pentapeptide repeats
MGQEDIQFTCEGSKLTRKGCTGEPFFGEHEGKRYCVLHFPVADKKTAFDIAIKRKLESKDFNFEGVWFPGGVWLNGLDIDQPVNFSSAVIHDTASFDKTVFRAEVSFKGAIFNGWARFEHTTFIKKVDFSSARFRQEANFWYARFEGYAKFWPTIFESNVSFYEARFLWANFRVSEFKAKAVFSHCEFDIAEFTDASFSNKADFTSARFAGKVNFAHARFDTSAHFSMSEFGAEVRFTSATFNGETDFSHTVFKDIVGFSAEYGKGGFGINAQCDFQHARFETPKEVSFHSVTLRPHWFINLVPREFQFIDVKWIGNLRRKFIDIEISELRKREELEEKDAAAERDERLKYAQQSDDQAAIESLNREEEEASKQTKSPDQKLSRFYRLLSITCRQLAGNAEDNHRYDERAISGSGHWN